MRESFKRAVVSLVRRSEILERAVVSTAARTAYESLKRKFIANGKHSPYNEKLRSTIVARFESIDRHVPIKTTPSDGLFLAELLLSMQAPGSIVECGCYAGGSSAKLSIIGDILGRESQSSTVSRGFQQSKTVTYAITIAAKLVSGSQIGLRRGTQRSSTR